MVLGELQPGYLLAGRYRLEEPLGSGGHAYVYSARQEGLDRKVAVKLLKSAPGLNEDALPPHKVEVLVKRFEQEAKLISQLRDPGTITMYDYGATDDGLLYMVVEFIEGDSLKELQRMLGAMQPNRVVKILEQLLYSLQEAHALGVLHRDIKPDNIMLFTHLGRRDQVKLLDFGIAKMVNSDSDGDLTAEGSVVGTPRYIAPERIRGADLTPAADLYSLGLVAYEMLTGERVMAGLKGMRALQSQLSDPSIKLPPNLDIPHNLRRIIDRMMEKDPTKRYQLAEHIIRDLEFWKEAGALPSETPSGQFDAHTPQAHVETSSTEAPTRKLGAVNNTTDPTPPQQNFPYRPTQEHTERLPNAFAQTRKPESPESPLSNAPLNDPNASSSRSGERPHAADVAPSAPSNKVSKPASSNNLALIIGIGLILFFLILVAIAVIIMIVMSG
jgi:serine/threonine protein kinase